MNLMKKRKDQLCSIIEQKDDEINALLSRIEDLEGELSALDDIRQLHITKSDLDEQRRWIDGERNGMERERLFINLEAEQRISEILTKVLLGQPDSDRVQP